MTVRKRCGECGRSVREDDTALVRGHRSGNYRQASRMSLRRVCRECVAWQVGYVREGQRRNLNSPLDTFHVTWSDAALLLGIPCGDLWRNEYERRQREGS